MSLLWPCGLAHNYLVQLEHISAIIITKLYNRVDDGFDGPSIGLLVYTYRCAVLVSTQRTERRRVRFLRVRLWNILSSYTYQYC
jgi:hypothetical protein